MAEVGFAKESQVEIDTDEVGTVEVGSAEEGKAEVRVSEIGITEVSSDKVELNIYALFPPQVPRSNTLFEDRELLLVGHSILLLLRQLNDSSRLPARFQRAIVSFTALH